MKAAGNQYAIVGLVGRAGAGKDTCARILAEHHGFVPMAFATPVRSEIALSFGVDPRIFIGRDEKERRTISLAIGRSDDARFISHMAAIGLDVTAPRSPREIMRWWGTDYRRQLDGDHYWIHRAHEVIESLHRAGWRRIAVTDVRFVNEAHFLSAFGAEIWRIRRRASDTVSINHQSEAEMEAIQPNRVILNDDSLPMLVKAVNAAYAQSAARVA
jgi:hypothetical protein